MKIDGKNSAIGKDALEFADNFLTPKEILESNKRVSDLINPEQLKEENEHLRGVIYQVFEKLKVPPELFDYLDKLKVDSSFHEDYINDSKVFIIKITIGNKEIYEMRG